MSSFSLAEDAGSGTSDILQAAVHLRAQRDAAYLAAAFGYGYGTISTERTATLAGLDRFGAEFDAHTLAADLEAGYQVGPFTPYLGVNAQWFNAPGYAETTLEGVPTFALSYEEQQSLAVATEVGVRIDHGIETEFGRIDLDAGLAWMHALVSDNEVQAAFQEIPGSQFGVQGATGQPDSVELDLGMQVSFDSGFALGAEFGGGLSADAMNYGGALRLSAQW